MARMIILTTKEAVYSKSGPLFILCYFEFVTLEEHEPEPNPMK